MPLPPFVKLVEVGARDGLQNEPEVLPAQVRAELIERLAASGLCVVEAGAFVSPQRVPQMARTAEVLARLERRPGVSYPVLVPNLRGLDEAIAAGADEVAVFAAASETFSERNLNASIGDSLARFSQIVDKARSHGVRVRGYVSCVLGCPYEGEVAFAAVADVAWRLYDIGCYEISLGDTLGVGTAGRARNLVEAVAAGVPRDRLAVHFHDTYGQALANILAVLDGGVTVVDTSVAGLGGCPFAPGAGGNVATEDVLYMLEGLGVETGVELAAVVEAGRYICERLGREPASKAHRALAARI